MRSGKEAQKAPALNGKQPSEADFIYFAGLFDGEGSIDSGTNRIRVPRLKVAMTDGPTLDWLFETFGGNIVENPSGTAKLMAWKWYAIRQVDVRAILEGSLPYLKLKRRRAEAALAVLDYLRNSPGAAYGDDGWLDGLHVLTEQCFARAWQQRPCATVLNKPKAA